MKSNQKGFTAAELIWVILLIAAAGGWAVNIYKLVHHINDPMTALELLRMVGTIVVPLGVVLGYL